MHASGYYAAKISQINSSNPDNNLIENQSAPDSMKGILSSPGFKKPVTLLYERAQVHFANKSQDDQADRNACEGTCEDTELGPVCSGIFGDVF